MLSSTKGLGEPTKRDEHGVGASWKRHGVKELDELSGLSLLGGAGVISPGRQLRLRLALRAEGPSVIRLT